MTDVRHVLFIQGAGDGTHDEWDDQLVDSLRRALGDAFDVRYPRMPHEDDPSLATWGPAIRNELARVTDGAIVVGHSVGGAVVLKTVAEHPPASRLDAMVLLATPFVGDGGWPGEQFAFGDDLGDRLPPGVPVHVFQGTDDATVPPAHAELFARAIPGAHVHRLAGRDHQLDNDLRVVADVIRELPR